YPKAESGLWRQPFDWILGQARQAGFRVDAGRLAEDQGAAQPASAWDDKQHESLTALWWPAEFFPKLCWRASCGCRVPQMGLGRHRYIADGQLLDKATLLRIRETGYLPKNLAPTFLQRIRERGDVPETLPYLRDER